MSQGKARLGLTEVNNHACPAARTVSPANAANLECFVQWPKVTFELDIFSELFILLILLQKFPDSFLDFILPKRMSQSATLPRRQKKKRRRMDHPDGPGWSWRALLLTDQACCALACPWRPGRQEWESAPPPDPGTTWRRPLHATTVMHQSHLAVSKLVPTSQWQ